MKRIFIAIGMILCLFVLSVVFRCVVYETQFNVITTENDKTFFVVIEQKGRSNIEHQVNIYSSLKKTSLHCDYGVNRLDISYDSTINNVEFYKINILSEFGYTTTYLKLYSNETDKIIDKDMLVKNFDDYDYPTVKEYILEKLLDGEFEWLYSYGEALLLEGHYEILDIVKSVNTVEQCKNDFVEAELLHEKCKELLQKYGGEQK